MILNHSPGARRAFFGGHILRITSRKAGLAGLALVGTGALVLVGCAPAPEDNGGGDGASSDFLPCMISDAGGFDDKSFNQSGYEGLLQAAEELGVETKTVESDEGTADYAPGINSLVDQGCNVIVTVGFALSQATVDAAKANEDIDFILIDDAADNDFDGNIDAEGIKPLLYNTAEAAFLGGYAAASTSTTGVVGTFGGQPYPTVTIFMDGFKQGVEYYNETKGTDVTVLGWDGSEGSFTNGFAAGTEAYNTAKGLLDQNVDVLLPVGGPIYQSAATAIRDSGKDVALIGVDSDVYESDPSVADLLLTSIQKGLKVSVYEAVLAAGNGSFDAAAYVGTLDNDGVGIADFHDWTDKVKPELAAELDEVKAGIIAGDITVESYLAG